MKIGIVKEGKTPPDKRVPFTPSQCALIKKNFNIDLVVQPSNIRSYTDEEYQNKGITLQNDLGDCDVLMGVKEVKINELIANKKYFFFSHTIKKQPYNKDLMQALIANKIQMIDYETLTHKSGGRILGFGRYAGIVGTYNALLAYGKRSGSFDLKPANLCKDFEELKVELKKVQLPALKIILTGKGRVGHGAIEIMKELNLKEVSANDFLNSNYNEAVYCNIDCEDYYKKIDGGEFDYPEFYSNPKLYKSNFKRFTSAANIFVSCHYWDNNADVLFTKEDTQSSDFNIEVIADITCDINGSVPTTIRPSTIDDPIYGINPSSFEEDEPFAENNITIMAVDNLPCELPRDASEDFGNALIQHVIPVLQGEDPDQIIERASICKEGKLTSKYEYLSDYAY